MGQRLGPEWDPVGSRQRCEAGGSGRAGLGVWDAPSFSGLDIAWGHQQDSTALGQPCTAIHRKGFAKPSLHGEEAGRSAEGVWLSPAR